MAIGATEEERKGGGSRDMAAAATGAGRGARGQCACWFMQAAGGECEMPALGGGIAPVTGGLAAGGSRGG